MSNAKTEDFSAKYDGSKLVRLNSQDRLILTFPLGANLRALLLEHPGTPGVVEITNQQEEATAVLLTIIPAR